MCQFLGSNHPQEPLLQPRNPQVNSRPQSKQLSTPMLSRVPSPPLGYQIFISLVGNSSTKWNVHVATMKDICHPSNRYWMSKGRTHNQCHHEFKHPLRKWSPFFISIIDHLSCCKNIHHVPPMSWSTLKNGVNTFKVTRKCNKKVMAHV